MQHCRSNSADQATLLFDSLATPSRLGTLWALCQRRQFDMWRVGSRPGHSGIDVPPSTGCENGWVGNPVRRKMSGITFDG